MSAMDRFVDCGLTTQTSSPLLGRGGRDRTAIRNPECIRTSAFRTGSGLALRTAAVLIIAALAIPQAVVAAKRQVAANRYKTASQLYDDLGKVPQPELGRQQYELVIAAFEAVRRADPSSGYCDDALLAIAKVYEGMAVRFGGDSYLRKAAETYKLLAIEYPHSKHREPAMSRAASLSSMPPSQSLPTPHSPASAAAPVPAVLRDVAALSDEFHGAGKIVAPSGSQPTGGMAAISEIRHHSYEDGTRLVLHLDGQAPLKYDRLQGPDRLYIDIFGSRVSEALIKGTSIEIRDGLISAARLGQNRRNKARLVLDLRSEVSFDAFWLDQPTRLVVDVRAKGAARAARTMHALNPTPDSETPPTVSLRPQPAARTSEGRFSLTRAMGLKSRRILIDAGHGGHDTGSVGSGGLQEKEVVLDIAKRLGALLEGRLGAEVIQTRESDVFIELEERVRIANEQNADLMISIHCNSTTTTSVRGIETYYLSLTTDPWALEVASHENASADYSVHQLEDLISKITLGERTEESKDFATRIQTSLHSGLSRHSSKIRDRGIRKAPFVVLIGAEIPAVLAEIGFISNRQDEQLMRQSEFRQEVAEHLFQGIADYMRSLGTPTVTKSLSPGSAQRD